MAPQPVPSTAMSTPSQGAPAAHELPFGAAPEALRADLSALYALSQNSRYVFASPLGPISSSGRTAYLPRFVFFGPHASDDSWRLAILAGFDHRDLRASRALVALASRLAADSDSGHALNLTFFPVIDIVGLASGRVDRGLASAHWGRGAPSEIGLLERDARQRGYHGFVTVETGTEDDDLIVVRARGPLDLGLSPDLELVTSEETRSFPVRFESGPGYPAAQGGPLSIADDLPLAPFELTLRIPGAWSDESYQHAAVTLLERFLGRYRAFQAYGQHL
jgi:hypothetical protein